MVAVDNDISIKDVMGCELQFGTSKGSLKVAGWGLAAAVAPQGLRQWRKMAAAQGNSSTIYEPNTLHISSLNFTGTFEGHRPICLKSQIAIFFFLLGLGLLRFLLWRFFSFYFLLLTVLSLLPLLGSLFLLIVRGLLLISGLLSSRFGAVVLLMAKLPTGVASLLGLALVLLLSSIFSRVVGTLIFTVANFSAVVAGVVAASITALSTTTSTTTGRFAGRTIVKDDLHTGRLLSIRNPENAFKIKSLIKENPRITIRELSEDLDISFGTCQTIIKNDLHLKRSPGKFITHLLTNEQKEHCKKRAKTWSKCLILIPIGSKMLSWEMKNGCTDMIPRLRGNQTTCLLITFFDVKGLVHYEFVPEGQTINQQYYLDVLRRLREAVRQKRPKKWHPKNWLLHHDNALPHTAVTVQLYLAKHEIDSLPQPSYSPELAPNDFFLYPKIKKVLKRR
ncbi:hypothetical protein LAZ67_9001957 [Cordylochernes scorpioides]|uniref:Transposase n=1 Tax=Cordylochernes scorpioides TaxID=51811 RepID=A0ABY6KTF4_9ARAC|nr:hypothetical protein LAZ67_9001957 [Cordylochernes scorpioides]